MIRKLKDTELKPDPTWIPKIRAKRHRKSEFERKICNSKRRFETLEAAIHHATIVRQHVYQCHICKQYHLTTKED